MTILELKDFVNEHKANYSIQLKRLHPNVYNNINRKYDFITFGEKIYHYINNGNVPMCKMCSKPTIFDGYWKGYRTYCSCKCRSKDVSNSKNEYRNCVICNKSFKVLKTRTKTTCSPTCLIQLNASDETNRKRMNSYKNTVNAKYGVNHAFCVPEVIEKIKATKLIRYNNINYNNRPKAKQTKLLKYGNSNYNNYAKSQETKLVKYGDKNYNNREKFKDTNIRLYGVEYPITLPEFKLKSINVSMALYNGVGLASDLLKNKAYNTNIRKYGYSNPLKNADIARKMKRSWYDKIYDILLHSNRFNGEVKMLFNKEDYTGSKKNYKFQCLKCNSEFIGTLRDGKIPRCLKCHPYDYIFTKTEREIYNFLLKYLNKDDIITHDRKILNGKELDFYFPKHNIAIEVNGIIWHSEHIGNKNRNYHISKTNICQSKGIQLLHILEHEWIIKQQIIKDKLLHLLKLNKSGRIYARKCEIKEIDNKEHNLFLENFELSNAGVDNSKIILGAYYNSNLVATMSFDIIDKGIYQLNRFCVNRSIIGIAGKLFAYFTRKYNPLKIITYINKKYYISDGVLKLLGFKYISKELPTYSYFELQSPNKEYNKLEIETDDFIKTLCIYDITKTKWENLKDNNWDRIWDCGQIVMEWVKKL